MISDLTALADALNQGCHCLTLDSALLARALDSEIGEPGLSALLRERCPTVFSAQPVFVAPAQMRQMAQVVRAIEAVARLPAWRAHVRSMAPPGALREDPGAEATGVFFGHDFHLDRDRLTLIEVNTNAGGALLNAVLARAQRACCPEMEAIVPTRAGAQAFETAIVEMFREEWRRAGRSGPLRTIAIVDESPERQYLYPEFLLFRRLFEQHGLHAVITDPAGLVWRGGRLQHTSPEGRCTEIDLVYNRLTDFYFEQPASAALRQAWLERATVITPHPQAHALLADKRHLTVFSDAAALEALGAPPEVRDVLLAHVPRTELVTPDRAEALWAGRRHLFFKPTDGYGSRAAWRGDKLTRRVWDEILAGRYVAQTLAPPGERRLDQDDNVRPMKFDLRVYAYGTRLQWVAARLYQGQTTNFRTPGGGFAPVYSAVDPAAL